MISETAKRRVGIIRSICRTDLQKEPTIIDAVETVIVTNQALTPNLDSDGSRN